MNCVNKKLWDILSCFHYILNAPRIYTYSIHSNLLHFPYETFALSQLHQLMSHYRPTVLGHI